MTSSKGLSARAAAWAKSKGLSSSFMAAGVGRGGVCAGGGVLEDRDGLLACQHSRAGGRPRWRELKPELRAVSGLIRGIAIEQSPGIGVGPSGPAPPGTAVTPRLPMEATVTPLMPANAAAELRSEEHTSELQSH
mgnify:CR=1 FL=1